MRDYYVQKSSENIVALSFIGLFVCLFVIVVNLAVCVCMCACVHVCVGCCVRTVGFVVLCIY